MRAKKLLTSRQIFRYAVPARTVTKKHWFAPIAYLTIISFGCTEPKCGSNQASAAANEPAELRRAHLVVHKAQRSVLQTGDGRRSN